MTGKTWQIINKPTMKHVMFQRTYKKKQSFWVHNILTEGVFFLPNCLATWESQLYELCGLPKMAVS
jgi:hypothetical protein